MKDMKKINNLIEKIKYEVDIVLGGARLKGLIEGYLESFNLNNEKNIKKILRYMLKNKLKDYKVAIKRLFKN